METNAKRLETEVKLQRAFIKLMTRTGFEHVSVQALTREAGINRGTFYLHYIDKFDLLAHYEDELVNQIHTIFERYPKPTDPVAEDIMANAFWQLFHYLFRQRELAVVLLQSPASQMSVRVKQLVDEVMGPVTGYNEGVPAGFSQALVAQGVLDYIGYWLTQATSVTPDEAYVIFNQTRVLSPQQLLHGVAKR